jgi:hypothetical protein
MKTAFLLAVTLCLMGGEAIADPVQTSLEIPNVNNCESATITPVRVTRIAYKGKVTLRFSKTPIDRCDIVQIWDVVDPEFWGDSNHHVRMFVQPGWNFMIWDSKETLMNMLSNDPHPPQPLPSKNIKTFKIDISHECKSKQLYFKRIITLVDMNGNPFRVRYQPWVIGTCSIDHVQEVTDSFFGDDKPHTEIFLKDGGSAVP